LSRAAACGWSDDDISTPRGGDDEDDPDMLLQSTAALATSPLHNGLGDESSLEETSSSSAFHLLMRLSLLGDLALLVLRLACSAPLLRCSLFLVKNLLLWERRLGRHKVGALQLQRQEGVLAGEDKL
jgi:hypothetical protein